MALVWLLPAVWVLVRSLRLTETIVRVPPEWLPWPVTGAHYHEVLLRSARTARIGRACLNSVVVSMASVALVVGMGATAAYPLAWMRFPGRDLVFAVLVGSRMILNAVVHSTPVHPDPAPRMAEHLPGLIAPEAAMTFAFGVFLLRQFFLTPPRELEDAARIDGANAWGVFTRIALPLS